MTVYSTSTLMPILQLKDDSIKPQNLKLDLGEDLEGKWFDLDKIEEITTDFKTIFTLYLYKSLNR